MKEFIPVSEARETVLSRVRRLPSEHVKLDDTLGRTLSLDVESRQNIPPFDNSAMDGFALLASDVRDAGAALRLVGEVAAGSEDLPRVEAGTCVRIMTGAPIPPGADAVLQIEVADVHDDEVTFRAAASPGEHIRRAGEDLRAGARVLERGSVVSPAEIAVLASLGYAHVQVSRRPAVSIVTTGDELIDPAEELRPGKIRDSNLPSLAARVITAGGAVQGRYRARDDRDHVRTTLKEAANADVLLVAGGVSVGAYDFVKDELARLGLDMLFWRIRQRPGKPLAFGVMNDCLVFGLPGNPVSAAVCFEMYVRPALAAMQGRRQVVRPTVPAELGSDVDKHAGLHYFVRGTARWESGRLVVEPTGAQGSHIASSLVAADGFIHLEEDWATARKGTAVRFEPF